MQLLNSLTPPEALLLGIALGALGMLAFLTWLLPNGVANRITSSRNTPVEVAILGIGLIVIALLALGRVIVQVLPFIEVSIITWVLMILGVLFVLIAWAIKRRIP